MTKLTVAFHSFANMPKNSLFPTGQGGPSGNISFAFRKCITSSNLGWDTILTYVFHCCHQAFREVPG